MRVLFSNFKEHMNKEDLNSPEQIANRIKNNLGLQIYDELDKVKGHPRVQIFIVHGYLELMVNAIIKNKTKNSKKILTDSRSYSHASKLVILHEMDIINDSDFKVLEWFRKLRNRAAHEPIFTLTDKDLSILIQEKYKRVENFHDLCFALTHILWDKNKDFLYPLFFPNLP